MVILSPLGILIFALFGAMVLGFSLGARLIKKWVSLGIWGAGLFVLFLAAGLLYITSGEPGVGASQPDLPAEAVDSPQVLAQAAQPEKPPPSPDLPGLLDPARASGERQTQDQALRVESEVASKDSLKSPEEEAPDTSSIWRLTIPSLRVDAQVISIPLKDGTWDITGLKDNVAWLGGTSRPGLGGNTVLAGHIMVRYIGQGPFRRLDRLKPGAVVQVYSEKNIYTYRVREQALVDTEDVFVTENTPHPQITLITCSNWDEKAETYRKRRAVYADLVKVAPLRDGFSN